MSVTFALALALVPQAASSPVDLAPAGLASADLADARCLLAMGWLTDQQKDQAGKLRMTAGIMFFAGKLAGRGTMDMLPAAIAELEAKEPKPDFASIANSCSDQMTAVSAVMAK